MKANIVALVVVMAAACDTHQQGQSSRASAFAVPSTADTIRHNSRGCLMATDSFGYAEVNATGLRESHWVLDADFGVGKDSSFYVALSERDLGHFELQFATPGVRKYPGATRHDVAALAEGSSIVATLTVYDDSTGAYTSYQPSSGEWTIHDAGPAGVCGTFALSWTASGKPSSTVRTTGEFRAAQNRYTSEPGSAAK